MEVAKSFVAMFALFKSFFVEVILLKNGVYLVILLLIGICLHISHIFLLMHVRS